MRCIGAEVADWEEDGKDNRSFSIVLPHNPLHDFVELPEEYQGLNYSQVLCGVIRGALEMVQRSRMSCNKCLPQCLQWWPAHRLRSRP